MFQNGTEDVMNVEDVNVYSSVSSVSCCLQFPERVLYSTYHLTDYWKLQKVMQIKRQSQSNINGTSNTQARSDQTASSLASSYVFFSLKRDRNVSWDKRSGDSFLDTGRWATSDACRKNYSLFSQTFYTTIVQSISSQYCEELGKSESSTLKNGQMTKYRYLYQSKWGCEE